ncbi:hypothetical protein HHI36_015242 [Cryptolaemus montrouzieri]|uniref:Uncharacterized protein n=1 Tax=Cryptolaemus montrouzieri TaxID=559131 RepID=A0ABD2N691_9CUCU
MCFDEERRRISTYLKTNQDISSKKLKDIPIESTKYEVFLGGEESLIETLRSLPREPVLIQMNTAEYEVHLLNDSEEVHFNDDIVMLNSSNNIEYHDSDLLTFDVEDVLKDNMVHQWKKILQNRKYHLKTMTKLNCRTTMLKQVRAKLMNKINLLLKQRKTVIRMKGNYVSRRI